MIPPRQLRKAVPRSLQRICLKALAPDSADRYASAGQLERALRGYLRRRYWLATAAVVVGILVVAMIIPLVRPPRPQPLPQPVVPTTEVPLDGSLILRVWTPEEPPNQPIKRGQIIGETETGALPVRSGESVHLEVRLNQPAFIYLLWVGSDGQVQPLYPWDPERGLSVSPGRQELRRTLDSPPEKRDGWPVNGPSGLETALLLARRTALPPEVDLAGLVGTLNRSPLGDPAERAVWKWSREQDAPRLMLAQHRGLETKARCIDDALLHLLDRLRPHFELIEAVRFAHLGE